MYDVVIRRTGTPLVLKSSKAGISILKPDHLINEIRMSTSSAERISSWSSWTSWGSLGEPVKRLLSTMEVWGLGITLGSVMWRGNF